MNFLRTLKYVNNVIGQITEDYNPGNIVPSAHVYDLIDAQRNALEPIIKELQRIKNHPKQWMTPEEYKKEFGEIKDGANVYVLVEHIVDKTIWESTSFRDWKLGKGKCCVMAGYDDIPPNDWRPGDEIPEKN